MNLLMLRPRCVCPAQGCKIRSCVRYHIDLETRGSSVREAGDIAIEHIIDRLIEHLPKEDAS